MFKQIAGFLVPSRTHNVQKIRLHYGPILEVEQCEAITFFMPPQLEWSGPLNHAIVGQAGTELDDYILENIINPPSGTVYNLPPFAMTDRKALFMAVLSEWDGGIDFDDGDLVRCYRGVIDLARQTGVRSVAFPAMGKDKRDFPHIRFARLAIQGILENMDDSVDEVVIACADRRMYETYRERLEKMGWDAPEPV